MMKVAYICEPQVGGTFVFFTQVRPLLARHGIDFRCLPPITGSAYRNTPFWGLDGVDYLDLPDDTPGALGRMVEHMEKGGFQGLLTLPGCHVLATTLPAYLPAHIGCVAKIPHNGRGTYRPAGEMEPYLDWLTPVNFLLADDLADRYGVPRRKIRVIHIGIDPDHFAFRERAPVAGAPVRLIFVGRLNDLEKNICLLPDMVKAARRQGVDVTCTVVGGGDDRALLEERIGKVGVGDHFTLTGAVPYRDIPALLQHSDLFLMPSRFEGCPHALMEAMATGCVPVVSHLRGTLDRIVQEGVTGRMAPVGNAEAFGRVIAELARDPAARARMGVAARQAVLERFTIAGMAAAYAEVFKAAAAHPAAQPPPRALADYQEPRSLAPTWRRWVPMPVKKAVRTLYGRLGKSI